MKLCVWIGASMVGACVVGAAWAAPPPMDRPSPPPCCADGLCYPNPMTWGHYATRWRRWPTDCYEPLPESLRPPAPLDRDVPAYEAPRAEEEDRRAPPPSTPRREPENGDEAPAPPVRRPEAGGPATSPVTPPRTTVPSVPPIGEPPLPFDEAPPPTTLPFGGEPSTPLPFGEPMGDVDPPPAPPRAHPARGRAPGQRAAVAPARPQADPPPALPIAMASWVD